MNAIRPAEPAPDVFYIEDDVLIQWLKKLRGQIRITKAGAPTDRR